MVLERRLREAAVIYAPREGGFGHRREKEIKYLAIVNT